MTKATDTLLTLFVIFSIYFALYAKVIPSPDVFYKEILPYLPFWGIVTLGSYVLSTLGYRILTFKDKPEKHQELLKQIKEAKEFYKSKGIDLDQ